MKMDVLVSFSQVHHTSVLSMQQKGHIWPLLFSRPSQTVCHGDYSSNLRLKVNWRWSFPHKKRAWAVGPKCYTLSQAGKTKVSQRKQPSFRNASERVKPQSVSNPNAQSAFDTLVRTVAIRCVWLHFLFHRLTSATPVWGTFPLAQL